MVRIKKKGNRNYQKGYRLERYISQYLSYYNFHVKRNYGSKGVEDLIAMRKGDPPYFIQCKASSTVKKLNMTKQEIEIFKQHAEEYGAIPIIVYSFGSKKYWFNVQVNKHMVIVPVPVKEFTKWKTEVNKLKSQRGIKSCNCYINENYRQVFISSVGL